MKTEPQNEHHWLQKLVGEWIYETKASMGPDHPPEKATGTESVRLLGGLWMIAEGQGEMPGGGDATTLMTVGYDPEKQRYVGSWVGSMMTHLWLYEGELDISNHRLSLHSEGPSMMDEDKMAKYKDVIEFEDDDHRMMSSYVLSDDGQWHLFMTVNYRRQE